MFVDIHLEERFGIFSLEVFNKLKTKTKLIKNHFCFSNWRAVAVPQLASSEDLYVENGSFFSDLSMASAKLFEIRINIKFQNIFTHIKLSNGAILLKIYERLNK